jgi:hypothetical protein
MTTFDPVLFSIAENKYLLTTLGLPPKVALATCPRDVNPNAVRPVLEAVYDLQEMEAHRGEHWVGIPAIKDAIDIYLKMADKWSTDRRRGRVRFPTMHTYDTKNKPHRGGPGSDSGQVRTYFDESGERKAFIVSLIPDGNVEWTPDWIGEPASKKGIQVDAVKSRLECPICNHAEQFKAASRASQNAARARMSKHLRTATDEPDAHRECHIEEFGG